MNIKSNIFLVFLGGAGELGANSSYLYNDGTGIIIDAGLHPKKRDRDAFPHFEIIGDEPVDLLSVTHAHTDHIGGIPFLLKFHPQIRIFMTRATQDVAELMLKDTAKLLKSEIIHDLSEEALSFYKPDVLEKINHISQGFKYHEPVEFTGRTGLGVTKMTFLPSGHILGSASIIVESRDTSILFTGDIKFDSQSLIPGAAIPERHFDVVVTESTNAGSQGIASFNEEKKKFAVFINKIVGNNGSILIPAFALGKTQEVMKILYELMRKGSIPHLPIYMGGLGKKISLIYDKYCYSVPRIQPGFEISDIPYEKIQYEELLTGSYFKEPSIVVASSGMMNKETTSFKLAGKWFRYKNFGIAFIGYQDEDSPGYELLHSVKGKEFILAGKKEKRICDVADFRFSSHATFDELVSFITKVKPKKLFIVHGDLDSSDNLALAINDLMPQTEIIIPIIGKKYNITKI